MNLAITHELALTDRDGVEHAYVVTLHPATDGQGVMLLLMAAASGTLGKLIQGLAQHADVVETIQSHLTGKGEGDLSIQDALGSVDWSQVGTDLRAVLVAPETATILPRVLAHTVRDGKPLSIQLNYDAAFRGNYAELLTAAWHVIRLNGFFPLPGIS